MCWLAAAARVRALDHVKVAEGLPGTPSGCLTGLVETVQALSALAWIGTAPAYRPGGLHREVTNCCCRTRRQTRAALQSWRIWTETIETAELLVSELVTNAVKFTGSEQAKPGHAGLQDVQRISLVLRHLAGRLIIEVFDPDPTPPAFAEADNEAECGRGLVLVQALSKEWNYYLPPSGGKVVYCVLASITDA